jgi:hypothetical protein
VLVARYWAEARRKVPLSGRRTVVLRRWGWSNASQEAAQALADARLDEALQAVQSAKKPWTEWQRREPRVPYNGAAGIPIREEILAEHGSVVITRNSYGAHCLNTPDVLFVDVDDAEHPTLMGGCAAPLLGIVLSIGLGLFTGRWELLIVFFLATSLYIYLVQWLFRVIRRYTEGTPRQRSLRGLDRWLASHPTWLVRVYETPAGLRLMAVHGRFDPLSEEVAAFMHAVRADEQYAQMCRFQRCFRARLTGKPWRMGIRDNMKPRPGVWPVAPERLAVRERWVRDYERAVVRHSACHFYANWGAGA